MFFRGPISKQCFSSYSTLIPLLHSATHKVLNWAQASNNRGAVPPGSPSSLLHQFPQAC